MTDYSATAYLQLSAVNALLGQIGQDILGVCVEFDQGVLVLRAFSRMDLGEDQVDGLDVALTEIVADHSSAHRARLELYKTDGRCLGAEGVWVHVRLGHIGVSTTDARYERPTMYRER